MIDTKKIDDGGPAMLHGHFVEGLGLSIRDWFAGQALAGLCGNSIPGSHHEPKVMVASAWALSDLMIAHKSGGEA